MNQINDLLRLWKSSAKTNARKAKEVGDRTLSEIMCIGVRAKTILECADQLEAVLNTADHKPTNQKMKETKETKEEYCKRASLETMKWLKDRTGHCHPLVYANLTDVREMLLKYMKPGHGMVLGNITWPEWVDARLLLYGYIWAKRNEP